MPATKAYLYLYLGRNICQEVTIAILVAVACKGKTKRGVGEGGG